VAPPLHNWETFYVIIGSSAAALTGLQFVVIALTSEASGLTGGEESVHAFATPTIVHFCAVLMIAAICTIPGHSSRTLALATTLCGLAGSGYIVNVIRRARQQTGYKPVFEDWLWHTILPTIAYATLFIAGLCTSAHPAGALYYVAATSLMLLFIGIHNAWDTAVYIAARR
jgi:hypothetical protein